MGTDRQTERSTDTHIHTPRNFMQNIMCETGVGLSEVGLSEVGPV